MHSIDLKKHLKNYIKINNKSNLKKNQPSKEKKPIKNMKKQKESKLINISNIQKKSKRINHNNKKYHLSHIKRPQEDMLTIKIQIIPKHVFTTLKSLSLIITNNKTKMVLNFLYSQLFKKPNKLIQLKNKNQNKKEREFSKI